jgi:hypothetical protein
MVDKVIVKVSGGIGNQLFQVAFGITAGRYLNARVEIDDSSFENYAYHHHSEIQKLNLGLEKFCDNTKNSSDYIHLLDESSCKNLDDLKKIPEKSTAVMLDGYWQSDKFFTADAVDALYKALQVKTIDSFNKNWGSSPIFSEGLALHIRRRDYAHMGRVAEEYYLAAVDYLIKSYDLSYVILFSDEPNYSRFFLKKGGVSKLQLVASGDDWMDLYLMSRFKYLVMSNSTYSWWGAYFGEQELQKTIICPKPWLTIPGSRNPCPSRWVHVPSSVEKTEIDYGKKQFFLRKLDKNNRNSKWAFWK